MASALISDLDMSWENDRKKRRKLTHVQQQPQRNHHHHLHNHAGAVQTRWRTPAEQQIYSSKLLQALRHVRRTNNSPAKGREVREVANRCLAAAAKGTTRWSRAILATRVRLLRVRKVKKSKVIGDNRSSRRKDDRRKLPALERRVKVLSRLVPGCRKVSFQSLLEEVSDYIPALEMQVKALTALANILTAGGRESAVATAAETVNSPS